MSKAHIHKIFEEYAHPRIIGDTPTWPTAVEVALPLVATVDDVCTTIQSICPSLPTPQNLAASPGSYVPALKYILKELETEHATALEQKRISSMELPRLFSISPSPSMKWRHISINAELLANLIPTIATPAFPAEYSQVFYNVFNFTPFRIHR
jgi:hypothetical protein